MKLIEELNGVIIIDSLFHVVMEHGVQATYKVLRRLVDSEGVLQVATVLHEDLLEHQSRVLNYLDFLSALTIKLVPGRNGRPRAEYVYRKSGGKVIREVG